MRKGIKIRADENAHTGGKKGNRRFVGFCWMCAKIDGTL